MIAQSVLDKLATFDTPTVCNVIELFEIRPRNEGYVKSAEIRCNFPAYPPTVGFAATAIAYSSYAMQYENSGDYSWLENQINQFEKLYGPPIVVIQDFDDPHVAGMFGEIMCTAYKTFGAKGLITNGAGRDIQQVKELGDFQIFTNGQICSHGYFHLSKLYIPVTIGGLEIQPNDLLHADENGITQIPLDIASEVADACDAFLETEQVFLDAVNQSEVTFQQFKDARAESKAMQKHLRDQLTGKS